MQCSTPLLHRSDGRNIQTWQGALLRVPLNQQYSECNEVHTECLNEAAHIPTTLKSRHIINRKKILTLRSSKQHSGLIFWDSGFKPLSRDGQFWGSSLIFPHFLPAKYDHTCTWEWKQPFFGRYQYPAFYETRRFITVVTKARQSSTLWARQSSQHPPSLFLQDLF
jgi:hypothetical protein